MLERLPWLSAREEKKNAFAIKGTVLEALGFASMIYTVSSFIVDVPVDYGSSHPGRLPTTTVRTS